MENELVTTSEKILASALKEFAESGLGGARVDRIAERAGVNKAMIYYHFRSKENLYEEVLRRHFGRLGEFLNVSLDESGDLESFLLKAAEFYLQIFGAKGEYREIMLRDLAAGGHHVRKLITETATRANVPTRLIMLIEKGKMEGRYRQVDSKQALVSFLGMNIFYLIAAPLLREIWELDDETTFRSQRPQAVVDLFLHGLEAR